MKEGNIIRLFEKLYTSVLSAIRVFFIISFDCFIPYSFLELYWFDFRVK
jgi:hypothetical protein